MINHIPEKLVSGIFENPKADDNWAKIPRGEYIVKGIRLRFQFYNLFFRKTASNHFPEICSEIFCQENIFIIIWFEISREHQVEHNDWYWQVLVVASYKNSCLQQFNLVLTFRRLFRHRTHLYVTKKQFRTQRFSNHSSHSTYQIHKCRFHTEQYRDKMTHWDTSCGT